MVSEEPVGDEPAGLVYDDTPPCVIRRRRPGPPQSIAGPAPGVTAMLGVAHDGHPAGTTVVMVRPEPPSWLVQVPGGEFLTVPGGILLLLDAEGSYCLPPKDLEPLRKTEVAFAEGADRPLWPLATDDDRKIRVSYEDVREKWHGRWGRHFGATRNGERGKRVHVGVDLFADEGDIVVAMEPGEVLATLPFHSDTDAIYIQHDSGQIVNYGEIAPSSHKEFGITRGIGTGQRVDAGQPLARVGLADGVTHMLHVETFAPETEIDRIRNGKMQWYVGDVAPVGMLDPTRYLVRAQKVKYDQLMDREGA